MNGWDDIDLTERYRDKIVAFIAEDQEKRPWAAFGPNQ
jgi:hypothetical protein